MRQLLSLRRRYPDRVHFLMGNRDINKMRIVDELGWFDGNTGETTTTLPKHEGVYWHLRGLLPTDPKPSIPSNSAADRLKWMLNNTMGSIHAFEFRRDELRRERIAIMHETCVSTSFEVEDPIRSNDSVAVSDDEVAQSYISSCCPISGIMSQCEFRWIGQNFPEVAEVLKFVHLTSIPNRSHACKAGAKIWICVVHAWSSSHRFQN